LHQQSNNFLDERKILKVVRKKFPKKLNVEFLKKRIILNKKIILKNK